MDNPFVDNSVFANTRQEACENVARDFIYRNVLNITKDVRELVDEVSSPYGDFDLVDMYADGYVDGFSMAVELILRGALNLQEIIKSSFDTQIKRYGGMQ